MPRVGRIPPSVGVPQEDLALLAPNLTRGPTPAPYLEVGIFKVIVRY